MSAGATIDTFEVESWLTDALENVAVLDGRALDDAVVAVEQLVRRAQAVQTALISRAAVTARFRADGHRRVGSWVSALTAAARHDAGVAARVARTLEALPELRAAFEAGQAPYAAVEAITRRVNNPRAAAALPTFDQLLAQSATRRRSVDEVATMMRDWERHVDPDGTHADEHDAVTHRSLTIRRRGAQVTVTGRFGSMDGAELAAILDRFTETEFAGDAAHAVDELLPRTGAQRRADALMNALRAADGQPLTATDQPATCDHEQTAAPTGSPHPTREPLINLMISWSTLHQELRRHCGTASDVTDPFTFTDFCSRTTDGAPLDPADIVRAALLGHIRIIITDPAGRIEHVGRRQRLFRGLTRDAVLLHHHQCIWPGCTIPASRCQADHLHPHREGGPTTISNGGPLCGFHNRFKAAFGYRIERTPGGHWGILRPDGTSITPTRRSPPPIRYGIEVDAAGSHPPRPGPSGWELAA